MPTSEYTMELTEAQVWEEYEEDQEVIRQHVSACKVDGFCYMCQSM